MNKLNKVMSGVMLASLPNPQVQVNGQAVTLSEIQARIQQVVQFLIVIAMVVAVGYIVWGGIRWMMAAGNEEKAKKAKAMVLHGIYGAAIVLAVGVILQTVAGLVTRSFFG
ncbi:MAG TPA: pilin [Candidatus Paceibacterota bacterium]|nr:pilin [Candidatus Paceibacterota bacterium]